MAYLIGTDEAGYGPNLGPLVISATVWEVPDGMPIEDLYRELAPVVASTPAAASRNKLNCIAIADSKILYQSGKGLRLLERGLYCALAALGHRPSGWRDLWNILAPRSIESYDALPWYAGYDARIPLDCDPKEIEPAAQLLAEGLARAAIRLTCIRCRPVFEHEFNTLLDAHDSKGSLLSHATLELVAGLLASLPNGPILVLCDKHGGRSRYTSLLSRFFPDGFIEVRAEGRQESVYRFGPPKRRVEFRFQAKAETHLPAALASMASKYLRELAMRALNSFWCNRVAGLAETAGYPEDALRFKAEIAITQRQLGIDDRALWRRK
jgi:hypothetical protein